MHKKRRGRVVVRSEVDVATFFLYYNIENIKLFVLRFCSMEFNTKAYTIYISKVFISFNN